jgi:hypothetical protein
LFAILNYTLTNLYVSLSLCVHLKHMLWLLVQPLSTMLLKNLYHVRSSSCCCSLLKVSIVSRHPCEFLYPAPIDGHKVQSTIILSYLILHYVIKHYFVYLLKNMFSSFKNSRKHNCDVCCMEGVVHMKCKNYPQYYYL